LLVFILLAHVPAPAFFSAENGSCRNSTGFQLSHVPGLSVSGKKRLWECRARAQGKGSRACFGGSAALDHLIMTENLHPKRLRSVIRDQHTFLLDFQSRETGVHAGRFCCVLLETGQNMMALLNGDYALRHKEYSLPKEKTLIFS